MESVAEKNHRVYERRSTASYWTTELVAPEQAIFSKYADNIDGKDILDIGVGTGRTTAFLEPRARDYVALDYSARMVSLFRQRYPSVEIRQGDARDLILSPGNSFDFVLFSFNGIDTVEHADRMRILSGMYHVLKPGGVAAFSSHDLQSIGASLSWQLYQSRTLAHPHLLLNPGRALTASVRLMRRVYNRAHNVGKEVRTDSYAILNDQGLEFACLHYYVTEQEQQRQLNEIGFAEPAAVFRNSGDTPNSLYYVARKPG